MLDGKIFYHGITRKAIVAFGMMFNNMFVRRRAANGSIAQTLRVPLAYAAKSKMLARILQTPEPEKQQYNTLLPRMSFEVIAYE